MAQKGRYFSVRFSASLIDQLELARVRLFGERTSLAETIRRLLESHLRGEVLSVQSPPVIRDGWDALPSGLSEVQVDSILSAEHTVLPIKLSPEHIRALRSLSRDLIQAGVAMERLLSGWPTTVTSTRRSDGGGACEKIRR